MNSLVNLINEPRPIHTNIPIAFDSNNIATSDCNRFIPLYALYKHVLLNVTDTEANSVVRHILEYSKLNTAAYQGSIRNYRDLLVGLISANYPRLYNFTIAEDSHSIVFDRGVLYTRQGDILLILCVDAEYLLDTPIETIKRTPDRNNFTLLITDKFRNPIYKNLRKKIETEYVDIARTLGVDILETNRIDDLIYKNNVMPMKFKSVIQMKKFLKEVPKQILDIEL